jgi:hypothetical protein
LVRPRDGVVETMLLVDIDGDGDRDLVVMRSVGSGAYLSADAFRIAQGRVVPRASVSGLPRDADVVTALRASRTVNRHERGY